MAYCKNCGAYIPDGQNVCLACGFDENAEKQKNTGSGAASAQATASSSQSKSGQEKYKQVDSDFLRKQLEEQRRRQQENSRKWAEAERAQRQKAREEQARNFTSTSGRSGSDIYRTVRSAVSSDETSKVLAGLSYISVLFVLPYLFRKDDQFAMYHAKQGMTLFITGLVADLVGGFFGLGWLVALLRLYMIFQGIGNVVKGKMKPLPYIGELIK